jgi:hypothetical protein
MEQLRYVLAQEDTVLFIGSGISLWAGLPNWSSMIEELAQFVEQNGAAADLIRAEAKKGDMLQAASYGFDKLTKQQIGNFIRTACHYGKAKPHDIHKKIVSLGPRCFVTTNYDDLIEQSLQKWQPDRFYGPPVTNRHLTETAEIVHARAIDFIFKPHGDASDSESIILTREQYRQLLPQGERHAALEAVKMLLASRPVVYLGFGLRDPDFIYVRDLLANTYKSGTRDHYAIMADVHEQEIDYWRRNYGIHLINYATTEHPNKTRDHSSLLTLLDTLLKRSPVTVASPAFDPKAPDIRLALARHAAALSRVPQLTSEFPILVHSENRHKRGIWATVNRFDHCSVETFLDSGPEHALFLGLPGAGKSYSLRRAAARLADRLHETCLAEKFDQSSIVVPILADLKLYRGNLVQLISQTLPSSLPLHELIQFFKVKVFLDSFNEMPREFWESGAYESDFQQFVKALGQASLVIGSRTRDGLGKLEFPAYCLDEINETAVTGELQRLGINLEGRFSAEVLSLLQRPFYFQYVASKVIELPKEAHPRDFYKCLFKITSSAFLARFGVQLDIEQALSVVAYESLNRGEEAFPIDKLLSALEANLVTDATGSVTVSPRDITNWLVSASLLIPYSGHRVAFVHQSVTEYLAATELAKRYLSDPQTLKEKLTLTRWDQALFLTLSLLPPTQAEVFLQDTIKADFALALNAAKYLELGRDEVVSKLLSEVPKRSRNNSGFDWKIESAIEYSLPLTEVHEPQLRAIIQYRDSLGGAAVAGLVSIKGEQVKQEFLQMLVSERSDYNFCCNGIAPALRPFASEEDARKIAAWADILQAEIPPESDESAFHGFTSGAVNLLAGLDLSVIRRAFLPTDETAAIPEIKAQILSEILWKRHSTEALAMAGELLLRGINEAATTIYFISNFSKPENNLSWDSFTASHVVRLEAILDIDGPWGLDALECLCSGRPDLGEMVKQIAFKRLGLRKALLLYCASPADLTPVFQAIEELLKLSPEDRYKEPLHALKQVKFDWVGREQLFVQILRLRDPQLASAIVGSGYPLDLPNLGKLEIGAIDWWLEWMLEGHDVDEHQSFLRSLGSLFADYLNPSVQAEFLVEFNKEDSKFRQVLLDFVLPKFSDLTTDAFNDRTISFLLADLSREGSINPWDGHLLGSTATELFVAERLLPLLPGAQSPLTENLQKLLEQAGARHGRRYIVG